MSFRKKSGNVIGNTVGIVPRTAGAGLHAVGDLTKTALYGALDVVEGIGKTGTDIKTAVSNACKNGKRRQKFLKAPAALVASPFMAVEGIIETLRYSGCNVFRNGRNTIAHPFINFGHGVKRIGSTHNVRDFKFEKTDERGVTPKNRLAGLFK